MSSVLTTFVIYAYTSFAASWGVGPDLAQKFEKVCKCHVKIVDIGDGGGLLSRLKLEGQKSPADVVAGIDEASLDHLKELQWDGSTQLLDYGPFAFVYNSHEVTNPPQSFDDLLKPQWKNEILIEDPRLSTTGLGLLLWLLKVKGEEKTWEYLRSFKTQVKAVTPGWDLAYGLFKKGKGKLVFSYWTSPAYHIQEEKRKDIKAAEFKEGHYVQREFIVGNPATSKKELVKLFFTFMNSEEAQKLLPLKNFMYPAKSETNLPEAFKVLGRVRELPSLPSPQNKIDSWLKKWRELFS